MAKYVFNKSKFHSNVNDMKFAFKDHGVGLLLSYSYKTNSMPCVYEAADECGLLPEVVSEYEYNESLKYCNKSIMRICNGVSMTYEQMADHVEKGDLVNFNDLKSIEAVGSVLRSRGFYGNANVGIRIRYDDKSRFGVKVDDLKRAIHVASNFGFVVDCIHCHATNTRRSAAYRNKCSIVVDAILENDIRPTYIDLGGSMYSKLPKEMIEEFDDVCTYDGYAAIIKEAISRLDYDPVIILESGTALVSDTVCIEANVVRSDEYNRVVVDCTKYTLGMMHKGYIPYSINYQYRSDEDYEYGDFTVYGCTCMEDDVLIASIISKIPKVGDKIIFKNCGSYTYSIEPKFIIDRIGVEER